MTEKFPLDLEQVVFTRSIVVAMPEHVPTPGMIQPGPDNQLNVVPMDGSPGHYMVTINTRLNLEGNPASPYIIDMECIGTFKADDSLSDNEAIRGVTITGHSVVYGAIREAVAWLTARQPHGPLILGLSVIQPTKKPE